MKTIYLIPILALLITGCSLEKRVFKNEQYVRELLNAPDTIKIIKTNKVEIEKVIQDSLTLEALLECNDSNIVLIKNINLIKTQGVKTEVIFKNNTLYIKSKFDSVAWIKKYESFSSKEKIITIERDKQSTLDKLSKYEAKKALYLKMLLITWAIIIGLIFMKIKKII